MLSWRHWRAMMVVAVVLGTAAGSLVASATPAMAAGQTRYVSTTGTDTDNDCTDVSTPCLTIQYAVNQADSGDTVSIASGTYDESVRIRISLTLLGAGSTGSTRTTIDGAGDGNPSIWVDGLDTQTPPQVTVKDLDVTGNSDNDGIYVAGDPNGSSPAGITITDCVVDNNDDDGIDLAGNVTGSVTDTTADGNGDEGVETGDLENDPPVVTLTGDVIDQNDDGGVVSDEGSITINSSTLDHNLGAGVVADGDDTTVAVNTSTVSNTAPRTILGETAFGGGVLVFPGGAGTVQSSTIFGNTGQGVLDFLGQVAVSNSTISGTTASSDDTIPQGGIAVDAVAPEIARKATVRFARPHGQYAKRKHASKPVKVSAALPPSPAVTATITADNTTLADCNGAITDDNYNLDSDGSCAFSAPGSFTHVNPKLGPLADNGGPTRTLLPAKGSDAIDAIPTAKASCTTPTSDQRGISRPQGPACDIGAVEAAQPPIVISPKSLPDGEVGKHYTVTVTATGGLGAPYEWSLAPGSGPLPPGLTLSAAGVISGTPTKAGSYPIVVNVDDPARKNYTIVITAPSSSSPSPSPSPTPTGPGKSTAPQGGTLPDTGGNDALLGTLGTLAVGLGMLLLWASGRLRRRAYHRAH